MRQQAIHSLCCRCALSFKKSAHCYSSCPVSLQLTFQIKNYIFAVLHFFIPSKIQKYPKVVIFVFVFVIVLTSMLVPWAVRQSLAESLFFVRAASAFALDNRQCNKPTTKSPLLLQNTRLCCSFFYPDKNNAMLKSGGTSTELACFKLQNMS